MELSPESHSAENSPNSSKNHNLLLIINYTLLFVGSISSTLISKYYFIHKGSSKWVSTVVQSAGFPLLVLPVYLPFVFGLTKRRPFAGFTLQLLLMSTAVGVLLGLNNLLFSWGNAYLPVSTSSLLISSQTAFNLILSVLIVKQKVNFLILNCVVLLTLSSVLLGLGSSHSKPPGLTQAEYWVGFFSTLGAGFLFALYLPVMEKIYRKVNCYAMVIEMQLVMEMAATAFAATGMAVGHGFSDMRVESRVFDKGPVAYWLTIAGNLIVWQFCFMSTAGMVFLTTSLTCGTCMTVLMVVNVVSGVVVYGDEFNGVKATAAALCVWGFCSYLYDMYVKKKKTESE
ncbi:probable purine permease 4 [Phtheirospermum japonicum]|uniref:Probable purine permease n=1 Tax=Phtheirospermum japonicum TaxID=374723 RepID=A0A830BJU6_9LAMI|nr:probable purine permease 4 [Phtheirospermum japonicum]